MLTNGSPLGILNPIPYSQYWPTASKEKVDNNVRAVFNNYSSVRCNESVATEKILQEVDEGRMKLLSCSEIPSRSFAPMAMVVKGNAPSNEADRCPEHYRLIEDYRRSLLNKKIHLNQTTSLPKLRDVLFIASRLVGSDHTIQAVGLDIAGAFRHIPVAPQEAHLLNVKTSKVAAQHLVLPFGLKCSPFLFARPSGLAFRLIKAIITLMFSELLALMLLYVDDLLHLFATQATNQSGEPEAVLLLLWLTYGFKFQLHKLSLYDNPIKFTGFMLHLNDPKAGEITMKVPENKIQKAIEDLRSLRQQARVNLNTVEKMCGKLMWMCNLLPHLKSHLAPFYGSIAYMKRHGLRSMDPGHEMKQTINLWLRILTDHRFPKGLHVRPLIDEHRLVLASCDASLDGVGGCIWMKGQTYWFAQRLSGLSSKMRQEVLSSAKRATSSNMVTLELLAALITLSFIAEMSTEDRVPVMLMVDNQAAIGVLKKLYSKVPILRKLLLVALPSFATVLQGYEVCHDVMDDENIHELLAHRAQLPSMEDSEVKRLIADYPDMGSEEELIQILSKVDSRAEFSLFHKNRRRKGEGKGVRACEETGYYSDADNYDCHERRYKMIQALFEPERELHEKSRKLDANVSTLQADWDAAEANLDKLMGYTYGPGSTKESPSQTEGLTHQIGLLSGAMYELNSAAVASADELWAELDKIHYGYVADVDQYKSEMSTALNNLLKGISQLARKQSDAQLRNTIRLNKHGNKELSDMVNTINSNQVKVEAEVKQADSEKTRMEQVTSKGLDDAEDALAGLSDEVAELPEVQEEAREKARRQLSEKIEDTAMKATEEQHKMVEGYRADGDKKLDSFVEDGAASIDNQFKAWEGEEKKRRAVVESQISQEGAKVEERQEAFRKEFDSADEKSQRTAENFARETEKEWDDQEKVSADMASSMKELRGMLNEYAANTDKQAHELTEEARQKQAAIKKEISETISGAGASLADVLLSMDRSLSSADKDIFSSSSEAKDKVMAMIRNAFREGGEKGANMAAVLGQLVHGIEQGEKALSADVKAKNEEVGAETARVGERLQKGLDDLSATLDETARENIEKSRKIKETAEGTINRDRAEFEGKMGNMEKQAEGNIQGADTEMRKNFQGLLKMVTDAGGSAEDLVKALRGLAQQEGNLKGDILVEKRRSSESLQRLAKLLSTTDSELASRLNAFLRASGSGMEDAMKDEDNKANRAFQDVAAQASHGIESYEAEAHRIAGEMASSLGLDQQRARTLQQELKSVDASVMGLAKSQQAELSKEKNLFTEQLAQSDSRADAALAQVQAEMAGNEGKMEESLKSMLESRMLSAEKRAHEVESRAEGEIDGARRKYLAEKTNSAVLEKKLRDDGELFDRASRGYKQQLDGVLSSVETQKRQFQDNLMNLMERFGVLSHHETEKLRNLTRVFEERVRKLPQLMSKTAEDIERDFTASQQQIEVRLSELQHKARNAETEEERAAAMQAVQALEQMRTLAERVRGADAALKQKILNGEQIDNRQVDALQTSMKSVIGNLEILDAHLNSETTHLQGEVENVAQRTSMLFHGLESAMNQTNALLDREQKESELSTKFAIQ
ncbi:hypothetical protein FOZ63_032458, partial [Perkinsus olseni]